MSDEQFLVVNRVERFSGRVIRVVSDEVTMPGGDTAVRDYIQHPGAVAVVALNSRGEVALVRQYRHPVAQPLWELPAGLLDVEGEPAVKTAERELWEESDLHAEQWDVLLDLLPTPGCSDEAIRLFLARGISEANGERYERTHEEHSMTTEWVDLDTAADWALAGEISNASCVAGVLAAVRVRDHQWRGLRPADAPWPARPGH